MTSEYMNNLYRDLLSNSPQTVTIPIPSDMGTGQIAQVVTKQGAVVSDWKMNYFSDMNVRGINSEDYKQMEFQNFCFAYKKREPESLHIPSAELPVGETIAIIGLNGAGKSTLARCICGLEKKCGLLQVDGKTLDWKARLKHCYMVMQDTSHQLFTESVMDEVLLSMDNEDETVADEILKQFDLLEYKDRHPLSLSGGQKQRVAIASAIVSNREIIVFDEPTSGLDLKHMREVARSLKSLADQGKTLLVITHDPELVMAGCSYVVHMEKGQIKESYPLDESGSKKVLDFFRIRQ